VSARGPAVLVARLNYLTVLAPEHRDLTSRRLSFYLGFVAELFTPGEVARQT
jgi:hypothetical protein